MLFLVHLLSLYVFQDQMRRSTSELIVAIYRLLTMYAASSNSTFTLLPMKGETTTQSSSPREIVGIDERLRICIESVHNISDHWRHTYDAYFVEVHVMHGAAELCRHWRDSSTRTVCTDYTFPFIRFNTWVCFMI